MEKNGEEWNKEKERYETGMRDKGEMENMEEKWRGTQKKYNNKQKMKIKKKTIDK